MTLTLLSIILCALNSTVNGSKILAVFSAPSISHQIPFRPFTQELAKRGHEVTVITPDPAFPKDEAPENLKEIDLHDLSYKLWSEIFLTIPTVGEPDEFHLVKTGYEALMAAFEAQMNSDAVQSILYKNETFDLLIVEAIVRPAIVLSYKYECPLIVFSSFGAFHDRIEAVSGPFHPLLQPDVFQHRLHKLTVLEEIKTISVQNKLQNNINELEDAETELGRKLFGPAIPHIKELANNVDMLFLNVYSLWDNVRPSPPSLLHLGGLPQKPHKVLPKELKSYLDSSKNGIIYISFGTNVLISQIPKHKMEMLLKVFSKLPYDVLMKWNDEDISGFPKNLKFGKWFPQSDLLRHPKVKLFITQGGLQSTDEAIAAGVPMIGIPMIADQWFNVEQYGKFGLGIGLELTVLTEENLLEAINEVIGNQSYRRNVVHFRKLVQDQRQTSLERAVWWAEYLLRHGGKHLRSPAANMSVVEFLELELLAIVLIVFLSAMFLISCILKTIVIFL